MMAKNTVKSDVRGDSNKTAIAAGDKARAEIAPGPADATVQEKYRHLYTLLAWGSGVVFLAALLVISLLWPNPTPSQLKVQAGIMALAAGGFSTVISGLLNISSKVGGQLAIGAGGAFAVLILYYFYNPAVLQ
jgi:hypothetical protein